MSMDYAQMIEGCRHRDAKAQRALYDDLAPMCMAVCHRYVRDVDEAADLLQDGFVRIFEHLGRLKEPEKLRSWAYSVMVNRCVSYLRKAKRLKMVESYDMTEAVNISEQETPSMGLSMDDMMKAIDTLNDRLRTAFNLCVLDELSCAEAANMMGTTEGNVRMMVFRARAELKNKLER